jgi:rubredoxin
MAWEEIKREKLPGWVQNKAVNMVMEDPKLQGRAITITGDDYVYKVSFGIKHANTKDQYYRQLKSDYFETTPAEGTCPNCQKYIRRYSDDDHLTCHRCGWEYTPTKTDLMWDTTPEEGWCPNCEKYVRRYDDDDHLTCHRCGWEYTPSKRKLRRQTDSESGWCPNCEKYIRRYDDDDYLTCHRCGWKYKPLKERVKNLI